MIYLGLKRIPVSLDIFFLASIKVFRIIILTMIMMLKVIALALRKIEIVIEMIMIRVMMKIIAMIITMITKKNDNVNISVLNIILISTWKG